jgi:hypothetical protein
MILFVCLPLAAFTNPVEARENVTCGRLNEQVTVDGRWTTVDEWTDAVEVSLVFTQGSGKAYSKAKYDDNYLYVLIDFVSDQQTQGGDMAMVAVDPKNNRGSDPQTDDFTLVFRWNTPTQSVSLIGWGTGGQESVWGNLGEGFNAACSNNAENDPYGKAPHLTYEFQIPMKLTSPTGAGSFSLSATGFGIGVSAFNGQTGACAWPGGVDLAVPEGYASVTFTTKVVPEFSTAMSIVLFLVLAVATILLRHPSRQRIGRASLERSSLT